MDILSGVHEARLLVIAKDTRITGSHVAPADLRAHHKIRNMLIPEWGAPSKDHVGKCLSRTCREEHQRALHVTKMLSSAQK